VLIMEYVLLLLLIPCYLFNFIYLFSERNLTKMYFYKKLPINKKYFLSLKSEENQVKLVLIDSVNNIHYIINDVIEKSIYTYYHSEQNVFVFNNITKRMKISNTTNIRKG